MSKESKKILVVDDHENIRKVLVQMLSAMNFLTKSAPNGAEAYKLLKDDFFDLIISDINMPVMDGLELLEKIKNDRIETPVIFITASDKDETLKQAYKLGLDGFIEKPFNLEKLAEIIKDKMK